MYLSDRDIEWAIDTGKLIIDPRPEKIDPTSVDLHLDDISQAKIWDIDAFAEHEQLTGSSRPELRIANYNYAKFAKRYLVAPPAYQESGIRLVGIRGPQVIVRPGGFLLWQTRERVGTPNENADLICFVNGKSTKARAGIVVHLTAPTIHSSWVGHITLEIANHGPFDLVLQAGDVISQLTVAKVTSPPNRGMKATSATYDQKNVTGTRD